jgi:sugar lactone lactonase YvrE
VNRQLKSFREPRAVLGEGPLWDAALARLHWLDADQKKLFRLDPVTEATETIDLPSSPGSYSFRTGAGMIMAYRNKLALLDDDAANPKPIETAGIDFAVERFNDGVCDRAGRFWVGTMDRKLREPVGSLYRIDPDLSLHKMVGGVICSNGMAFSPDDRTFYHTDTGATRIDAYDFDLANGMISNRRVHAEFGAGQGRPDGCTIDAEGYLWVAAITAGMVVRIDPRGRIVETIALPTRRPTSAMFGGRDLHTLFITSMQHGLTPEQLASDPQAGCLFAVDLEIPGLAEPRFAG